MLLLLGFLFFGRQLHRDPVFRFAQQEVLFLFVELEAALIIRKQQIILVEKGRIASFQLIVEQVVAAHRKFRTKVRSMEKRGRAEK